MKVKTSFMNVTNLSKLKKKINNTSDELQMRQKAHDLHNMNNPTNVQHM